MKTVHNSVTLLYSGNYIKFCKGIHIFSAIFYVLNTIYSTSNTQKAYGTSIHILEGTDSGVCGLTWWRKPKNPDKTTDLRAKTSLPYVYTGDQARFAAVACVCGQRVFYHCAIQAAVHLLLGLHIPMCNYISMSTEEREECFRKIK